MAHACAADINDSDTELMRPRNGPGVRSLIVALDATNATAAPNPIPSAASILTTAEAKTASSKMQIPTTPIPATINVSRSCRCPIPPTIPAPASVPSAVSDPIAPYTAVPACNTSRT